MFRGSSTQLYVPAFTQKDFHYSVHTGLLTQGTSTEDLGKYNLGVHNFSLNQYNLSVEARHKANTRSTSQMRIGTKPNNNHLTLEG